MLPVRPIVFGGAAVILCYDLIGAMLAEALDFPRGFLAPGSFIIYALVGFLVAYRRDIHAAVLGTVFVGLVEGSLGGALSWLISPREEPLTGAFIAGTIVSVIAIAAAIGIVAGAVATILRRRHQERRPE